MFCHRSGGRESASFSYEASYLARQDAYALDPALPLVQGGLQTLGEVLAATRRWRAVAAGFDVSRTEVSRMAWAFEHAETQVARDIIGS